VSQPVEDRAVPVSVERFLQQLVITYKAVVLYPPSSTIPATNAAEAAKLLDNALAEAGDVSLAVSKQGVEFGGVPVLPGQLATRTFSIELYHRSVAAVRFRAGTGPETLVSFLRVLRRPAEEVEAAGGFAACLWDEGVDSITVTESSTSVVEADVSESVGAEDPAWPPDHERIAYLLATAKHPRAEGHRVLVRVLVDHDTVKSYVTQVHDRAAASGADDEPGAIIAAIARIIGALGDEERAAALRSLAEATRSLPQGRLRARTAERLVASARTDRAVAALVRQVGVDQMCRALTEGISIDDASVEGLARAIRNLAQISLASRDEVADAAGAAMRGANLPEQAISATLAAAMPTRIVDREPAASGEAVNPVDEVLRLVDLAATPGIRSEDASSRALRDEANRGFGDSDVTGALVTLAVLALGTDEFERSLELVEDALGLLLERGEFEVAADAADALLSAADQASPGERGRVLEAVGRLAGPGEMRALHRAMHLYERDSAEYVACRRLLVTLGGLAVGPLLEMLADEPDMALRKSMVELISSVADQHVEEVGRHVNDGRWYFVRNVVSILGATKRSESVPFLGRTLRHTDARVRRESVRALAGTPDPRAADLLVNALSDADSGNVMLAARYLGSIGSEGAVTALVQVAQGEGSGSRDFGVRSEAIEALGQIGSPDALPALESLAGRRRLVGGGRGKELAPVAMAAIDAINSRSKEPGR
jgi:hypothetical protein